MAQVAWRGSLGTLRDGVRNLPAASAGVTLHPLVVPARAVPNLQDDPEESGIARVPVLALPRVAEGGRVKRVEPSTTVGGLLVAVLGPALADCLPMPTFDLEVDGLTLGGPRRPLLVVIGLVVFGVDRTNIAISVAPC